MPSALLTLFGDPLWPSNNNARHSRRALLTRTKPSLSILGRIGIVQKLCPDVQIRILAHDTIAKRHSIGGTPNIPSVGWHERLLGVAVDRRAMLRRPRKGR